MSSARTQCTERSTVAREECVDVEQRTDQCNDWSEERHSECCEWQPCAFACAFIVWTVTQVCTGWVYVTERVCEIFYDVVDGVCSAVTTLAALPCLVAAVLVEGFWNLAALAGDAVCWVLSVAAETLVDGNLDEPPAASVPKPRATSMSIARVSAETAFRDSGVRSFFRIREGVVEVRTVATDWATLEPFAGAGPLAVSYHESRRGLEARAPAFDMVAADSGRVMVKERGRARFFFTMLDPMFRGVGNSPVPSLYFKLDPEQGQGGADNADRLAHLPAAPAEHPAAVRFPLFRRAMELDLDGSMVVNVDRRLRIWHRIDARPPKDGHDPPSGSGMPQPQTVVIYERRGLPLPRFLRRTEKRGYRVRRVLDIGVGHEHWHEQRCSVYGGEIDSLDGPGLPPLLLGRDVYRFFNGPIDDQGGFIDGTVNYYVLAQFVDDEALDESRRSPEAAFGILWLDEQAVLSERWRLLHPDDNGFGGFRHIVPSAAVQYLARTPDHEPIDFARSMYWCPLRAGHVTRESRMAVSRQAIVLSGRDPDTGRPELYSINFSFGTCDRTWRRRQLPPALAAPNGDRPLELQLREDMTLSVRDREGATDRYWYQRYLPASGHMTPAGEDLLRSVTGDGPSFNGPRPPSMEFPWQELPVDVFDHVHAHYSHFGCYESVVDWRSQYYRIKVTEGSELLSSEGEAAAWVERDDRLVIHKPSIDWTLLNAMLRGEAPPEVAPDVLLRLQVALARFGTGQLNVVEIGGLLGELQGTPLVRTDHRRGLFHPRFRFKVMHRGPLGWILVHWDKRDDDLLPFADFAPEAGTPVDVALTAAEPQLGATSAEVTATIVAYRRVLDPPVVHEARVIPVLERGRLRRVRVELRVDLQGMDLDENLWRIKLGAIVRGDDGALGAGETLIDELRVGASINDTPRAGWIGVEWEADRFPATTRVRLLETCTEAGRRRYGTSLWCENVVGHVATPDDVHYVPAIEI